jgi:adenylate kinase
VSMLVVVTGVPGVGKSTVVDSVARTRGFKIINFGTEMFKLAQSRDLVSDRDEMRRLAPDVQRDIQVGAARAIAAMGDVFVDTHTTVKTPAGYLPGMPKWVLDELRPGLVVLVEATDEEIHARRAGDPTRKRDSESVESIHEHQTMNRAAAMAYASLTGATVKVVMNHDDGVDAAVEELAGAVDGLR